MDVDLGHGTIEEVLQGAARLILRIEVEQCDGDFIRREPLGQGDDDACLADTAFAAMMKTTRFVKVVIARLHCLSGAKVRSHGTRSGQVSHSMRLASP